MIRIKLEKEEKQPTFKDVHNGQFYLCSKGYLCQKSYDGISACIISKTDGVPVGDRYNGVHPETEIKKILPKIKTIEFKND